jgi:hypothetical protein
VRLALGPHSLKQECLLYDVDEIASGSADKLREETLKGALPIESRLYFESFGDAQDKLREKYLFRPKGRNLS